MFTRRFFILLCVCIALSLLSLTWPSMLYVAKVAVAVLAVATVADALFTFVVSRRVKVTRKVSEHFSLDQPNKVETSVSVNLPPSIRRYVKIRTFDTPSPAMTIAGADSIAGDGTLVYNAIPSQRGRQEFGVARSFVASVLGLFESRRFSEAHTVVKVYPTYHRLDEIETAALTHNSAYGPRRLQRPGNNTEFDQIRSYVPGDDVRTVNWTATARATSLMVNQYTDERSRPIVPIVLAGPAMLASADGITLLDRAVSAAVALVSSAVRHYDEAGLITVTNSGVETFIKPERSASIVARVLDKTYDFGLPPTASERGLIGDPDVLPPGVTEADVAGLRKRMAACDAEPDINTLVDYVLARLRRRSLLVLLANFDNQAAIERAIPALSRLARRHTLVLVMLVNEDIDRVVMEPYRAETAASGRFADMRMRAVCADYLDKQEKLAAILRKHRINVLHSTPQDLTASVLRKYIEIKNQNIV